MEKLLSSTIKIRFQDCDPFNHLNNAKYIDYFINTREDQLAEHYKLDVFAVMEKEKKGWVVGSNQIAYFTPAYTMETVKIQSSLFHFSEKSLSVEMTMWNEALTQLKAIYWVKFIHVDLQQQGSIVHSEKLMNLFAEVLLPIPQRIFEERIAVVKKQPA
jgi:thioesterase-3